MKQSIDRAPNSQVSEVVQSKAPRETLPAGSTADLSLADVPRETTSSFIWPFRPARQDGAKNSARAREAQERHRTHNEQAVVDVVKTLEWRRRSMLRDMESRLNHLVRAISDPRTADSLRLQAKNNALRGEATLVLSESILESYSSFSARVELPYPLLGLPTSSQFSQDNDGLVSVSVPDVTIADLNALPALQKLDTAFDKAIGKNYVVSIEPRDFSAEERAYREDPKRASQGPIIAYRIVASPVLDAKENPQ